MSLSLHVAALGSHVTSGAVLTLALPIGFLLVVLAVWYFAFQRLSGRR
ncbi:MAG: hypothetical protein ABSG43_00535 [Solirubrobacteraceae bacterium]